MWRGEPLPRLWKGARSESALLKGGFWAEMVPHTRCHLQWREALGGGAGTACSQRALGGALPHRLQKAASCRQEAPRAELGKNS